MQADNWFCLHLLSEGDAGTLGKYNSHYSDDVLAHLIGEPSAGIAICGARRTSRR